VHDEALRLLGAARAGLEYPPLTDVVSRLPEVMECVQRACSSASDVIARRYFQSAPTSWVGE
jgi:A predicted alpha-helical domain with a conserved ER motif.